MYSHQKTHLNHNQINFNNDRYEKNHQNLIPTRKVYCFIIKGSINISNKQKNITHPKMLQKLILTKKK